MFDYTIAVDQGEEAERATVTLMQDGETLHVETFFSTFEDAHPASVQARSYAAAWLETCFYTMEERLGPFGREWEREQEERVR